MFNDSFSTLKTPCYDTKTKTDCPRRCAGCSVNCPEWAKYLKKRDELYRHRAIENDTLMAMFDNNRRTENKRQRKNILLRSGRRWKEKS